MNREKFLLKMKEKNYTFKDAYNELNISKSAFYRKARGISEFNRLEIKKLIILLELSDEEVISIFFEN